MREPVGIDRAGIGKSGSSQATRIALLAGIGAAICVFFFAGRT